MITTRQVLNAAAEKSSLENEQMSVESIPAGTGSGSSDRRADCARIVTYSKVGETVKQGDRMGIIRFGSRVDVFMPVNSKLRAKVGDITAAGVTVLADLPK